MFLSFGGEGVGGRRKGVKITRLDNIDQLIIISLFSYPNVVTTRKKQTSEGNDRAKGC